MIDNQVGYIVYRRDPDNNIKIFKNLYPSKTEAEAAIRKNSALTHIHISSYECKEIRLTNFSIIKPEGSYLLEADKRLHNLCATIESLGGCYIFNSGIDASNSFYIDFECDYLKSIGILSRAINSDYKPLNFRYVIEIRDFDFIKKNDKHVIYYRLYTKHGLADEEEMMEDINTITGNINYWNSPAFINYFNGEI